MSADIYFQDRTYGREKTEKKADFTVGHLRRMKEKLREYGGDSSCIRY
ncbi:MAG: hypothetical protein ACPG7D_05640 [Candidatus Puniceispirillaceae bacterium]